MELEAVQEVESPTIERGTLQHISGTLCAKVLKRCEVCRRIRPIIDVKDHNTCDHCQQ